MAYNPQRFETVYGFDLLDTLHNFFPEVLYDSTLFSSLTCQWIRHRFETLFPEIFIRQQNMYRIYQMQERNALFQNWRNTRRVQEVPTVTTRGPSITTRVTSTRLPRMPPPATGPSIRTHDLSGVMLPSIFSSLLFPGESPQANLFDLLGIAASFQDVLVFPTPDEIEAASQIVDRIDISEDTVCSVCQEHGTTNPWRTLECNHSFHKTCIDTWFRQNVRCPICRVDIRTFSNDS